MISETQAATNPCFASSWTDPLVILTFAYVICTLALWWTTRRAANAAKESADAAKESADATKETAEESKRSADLLAELNRPYMGVHHVEFTTGAQGQNHPDVWQITWAIRNFGTLPAQGVKAEVQLLVGETPQFTWSGPLAAEVFPLSDPVSTVTNFEFRGALRAAAMNGTFVPMIRIRIEYAASGGQRYNHRADWKFNRGYGTFSVVNSETKSL